MSDIKKMQELLSYFSRCSVEHKYLCIAPPKVACSTIKRTLHAFEGLGVVPLEQLSRVHSEGSQLRLAAFTETQAAEMLTSPEYFRFSFVRNPYDRLLSAWKSKIQSEDDMGFWWIRSELRERSFHEFINYILASQNDVVRYEPHWKLQPDIMLYGEVNYSFIGRFETFQQDFRYVLELLQAPAKIIELAGERTNITNNVPLSSIYTQELADIVYSGYKKTFDLFGYDRDSWKD